MLEIEKVVVEECILATNTSSIPLKEIFKECKIKNRCMGLHFFYPISITKTVEVNRISEVNEKNIIIVKEFLENREKKALILNEKSNMIMSQIILTLTAEMYRIYDERYLTAKELDRIVKSNIAMFGMFEIIDSTGQTIILKSAENFMESRYKKLYQEFLKNGKYLIEKGYPGGTNKKGLLDFEQEYDRNLIVCSENDLEEYRKDVILRVKSIIVNEIAYMIKTKNINITDLETAIQDILGLTESPSEMLHMIGRESIKECLLKNFNKYNDDLYEITDLSVLE